MSVIWIRHGEKIYPNGAAPQGSHNHDPPIKDNVKCKIEKICEKIRSRFGVPTKIISSPFLRTRETALLIKDFFNSEKEINIVIDNNISEYLGWSRPKGQRADVSEETNQFITPTLGTEKLKDVEQRSREHVQYVNKTGITVVVTHGIVIGYIYQYLTGKKMNRINELRGITYSKGKIEYF